MKRFVSIILALVMLLSVGTVLASCGEATDRGAEISVYLGDVIYDFDPQQEFTDDNALAVISLLFEPLFTLNSKGDVKKAAADDYSYDKDENTLTITLRETYWSDGVTQVRASDFVYAWKRLLSPSNASSAAPLLYDIKNAYAIKTAQPGVSLEDLGVLALDTETLQITFEDGFTDYKIFLRNLCSVATAPLNPVSVQGKEDYWAKRTVSMMSNGPFKVATYNLGDGVFTLERNRGYRQMLAADAPLSEYDNYVLPYRLLTVWNVEDVTSDQNLTEEEYLNQLLDGLAAKTVFYMGDIALSKRAEVDAEVHDLMSTYTYLFNMENELFADATVRKTLSDVLDRTAIANLLVFAKPATGLITAGVSNGGKISNSFREAGGDLLSTGAALSIADAQALLADAPKGEFSLTVRDCEEDLAVANYVKSQWEQLGYTVTIDAVSGMDAYFNDSDGGVPTEEDDESALHVTESALQYRYETGDFDVIGIDYQMFCTDAFVALAALSSAYSGNGADMGSLGSIGTYEVLGNFIGFKNDEYDALIASAYAEKDPEKRAEILHEAERKLMQLMPAIPLVFNQSYYVISKELSKVSVDYYGYTIFTDAKQKNYQDYLNAGDGAALNLNKVGELG